MSASPANPKKRKQHACQCCTAEAKKGVYCDNCRKCNCAEYPGDCGNSYFQPRFLEANPTNQELKRKRREEDEQPADVEWDEDRFRGYIPNPHRALKAEAQAVDDDELKQFGQEARLRHAAFRAKQWDAVALDERIMLGERLDYVRKEAQRAGMNLRSFDRFVEKRLRDLERRLKSRAA